MDNVLYKNLKDQIKKNQYKEWSGTQAEYEAAVAQGLIADGTIVKITDSPTPTGIQTSSGLVKFGGGSGGGHTIVDDSGTSMTQRSNLKFVGATITDDASSDTTTIEIEGGGGKSKISPPVLLNDTFTYDSTSKSPTFTGYISSSIEWSGDVSETEPGTYTIYAIPTSDYSWTDDTSTAIPYTWTINKADGQITLSKDSVVVSPQNTTNTVTVTTLSTGDITISGNDATVATASISGGVITITNVNKGSIKNTSLTVSVASDAHYTAVAATISIKAGVKIVTWASGTDSEIAAMVSSHMAGALDLTDYWAVGDERTVSLSAMTATGVGESHVAQNVTMVLVDKNNQNYTYTSTPSSGKTHPAFIVQLKNGLDNGSKGEMGYMNSTDTNSGSWGSTARRTWCNSTFRSSIHSTLRAIFHQVHVKTAAVYNGSTLQTTQDYFFLPAAKEVFGGTATSAGSATAYSNLKEFNALTQWKYYETSANRIKKYGNSGSAYRWWERSPRMNTADGFCFVTPSGTADNYTASNALLIAPVGCI